MYMFQMSHIIIKNILKNIENIINLYYGKMILQLFMLNKKRY